MMPSPVVVCWFRRDLRLEDNTALAEAFKSGYPVLPVFIFDRDILDLLPTRKDARVAFIHREVLRLEEEIRTYGGSLHVFHHKPLNAFLALTDTFDVKAVYTNRDYEPYARERDNALHQWLKEKGIPLHGFKDHVIFDRNEVMKDDGTPYTVFTPYSRKWKSLLTETDLADRQSVPPGGTFAQAPRMKAPSLSDLGFADPDIPFPPRTVTRELLEQYASLRDFPGESGTSRLSVHLRFGTISIRSLVRLARGTSEKWLDELIWREFYQMILYHFPHTVDHSFKPAYDRILWRNDPEEFERWKSGTTGYPLVDAGMRELAATGFMHNRVRMVVASFLTKHLLIDWRWGERYFAEKLLDFELASNVGGWQWTAGCGCDAAPYFRIFNPHSQAEKFDPEMRYIRRWVPEWNTPAYPRPIVDHSMARERCLRVFRAALPER